MSLLFGNLTQDFVTYSTIVNLANAGDPNAKAQQPAAAAHFRSTAGKDAGYLAAIGKTIL
jgi:ATP-binding cassette, subfamily B (MDR/TAP), member 1